MERVDLHYSFSYIVSTANIACLFEVQKHSQDNHKQRLDIYIYIYIYIKSAWLCLVESLGIRRPDREIMCLKVVLC